MALWLSSMGLGLWLAFQGLDEKPQSLCESSLAARNLGNSGIQPVASPRC